MTNFVYVKDQNALIALVQSTSEARDMQAMWLSIQTGLSKDEFKELPAPKQKLIELIDRKWCLTIQWLMYPPRLRSIAYPFNQIGRAVQQECRDLHSFPTRRSSDLPAPKQKLIELIDRKWCLTIQWLMYPPRLRSIAYPFN